ncbi:GD19777 [Drosophila simulans]|uniref:GD19777 n=1 Tax=Drosophila simulans TaxID=7240 RepID=B4QWA4_DROSI|nr:GD19777 [Drosophila simulans]
MPTSTRPLIIGFRHRANTVDPDYMDSGSQCELFAKLERSPFNSSTFPNETGQMAMADRKMAKILQAEVLQQSRNNKDNGRTKATAGNDGDFVFVVVVGGQQSPVKKRA